MLLFAFQSVNKTSFYRVELLSVKGRDRGRGLREVYGGVKGKGWGQGA